MKSYGCLASLILTIAVVLVTVGIIPDQSKQPRVQAQTGVIDLLPYKAYIPYASKYSGYVTPGPTSTPEPPAATPTPCGTPATTPYPTPTPGGNYNYVAQRVYRLNACENHGMLRAYITVRSASGLQLDGLRVVRYTSTGDYAGEAVTGDKGPGACEFSLESENGGNWHFFVDMPGQTSETAWGIRTDLGIWEECCKTGEPGAYFKHISYDVNFVRV